MSGRPEIRRLLLKVSGEVFGSEGHSIDMDKVDTFARELIEAHGTGIELAANTSTVAKRFCFENPINFTVSTSPEMPSVARAKCWSWKATPTLLPLTNSESRMP